MKKPYVLSPKQPGGNSPSCFMFEATLPAKFGKAFKFWRKELQHF